MYKLLIQQKQELNRLSQDLSRYLCACGEYSADTMFDVKLAVFELAGNILEHSKQPAEVIVDLDSDSVYVNIMGGNSFDTTKDCLPDVLAERGRGLFLVRSIAEKLEYFKEGRHVIAVIPRKRY